MRRLSREDDVLDQLPRGSRMPSPIQTLGWWSRPTAYVERLRRRYGARFTLRLTGQSPFVILSDPADVRELFMAPPDVLHPGEGAILLEPVVGTHSVILLDEAPHMEQRKLLLPAFHGDKMQALAGLITELSIDALERLPRDEPVALHPLMQELTLEIILRAVFGLDEGERLDELRPRVTAMLSFGDSPLSLLPQLRTTPFGRRRFARFMRDREQADELLFALMAERRASDEDRDDVLSMLLAATHGDGSPMTDEEIRDELLTALVAGHETTASSLAFAFELLARDRGAQERLRDRDDAAFLESTINEVMRCRPVLPNPEPRRVMKPITIGGHTYPPGCVLIASAQLLHHDPELYPDPYAFRPDRFLDTKPGTYTWIPFGGGRRRCLGASFALLEMRVVLREAFARFEVTAAGAPERARRRMITITPSRGGTVILRERATAPPPAHPEAVPAAA
jgi:cytochrome P450